MRCRDRRLARAKLAVSRQVLLRSGLPGGQLSIVVEVVGVETVAKVDCRLVNGLSSVQQGSQTRLTWKQQAAAEAASQGTCVCTCRGDQQQWEAGTREGGTCRYCQAAPTLEFCSHKKCKSWRRVRHWLGSLVKEGITDVMQPTSGCALCLWHKGRSRGVFLKADDLRLATGEAMLQTLAFPNYLLFKSGAGPVL